MMGVRVSVTTVVRMRKGTNISLLSHLSLITGKTERIRQIENDRERVTKTQREVHHPIGFFFLRQYPDLFCVGINFSVELITA